MIFSNQWFSMIYFCQNFAIFIMKLVQLQNCENFRGGKISHSQSQKGSLGNNFCARTRRAGKFARANVFTCLLCTHINDLQIHHRLSHMCTIVSTAVLYTWKYIGTTKNQTLRTTGSPLIGWKNESTRILYYEKFVLWEEFTFFSKISTQLTIHFWKKGKNWINRIFTIADFFFCLQKNRFISMWHYDKRKQLKYTKNAT